MNKIVKENLLTKKGYTPYCGNYKCTHRPRSEFTGLQFRCPACDWVSKFPENVIKKYKKRWKIKD